MSEIQETPVIQEKFSDSSSDSDEPEIIEEIIKEEQNAKVIQVNISAWQVTIWRFLQASNAFSFYSTVIWMGRKCPKNHKWLNTILMCDFCIPVDFLGINDLKKIKKGRKNFLKAKAAMKNLIFLLFFPLVGIIWS